jgi:glycosyltransferase involved in cell wall biosynthesis
MAMGTAHILVAGLRSGDATSHHTFDLVRVLRARGMDVHVFYEDYSHDLPPDIQPLVRQARYADYTPSADLTIVQYAIWFRLADRLRDAPGASLFWYHGVTPPALWGAAPGVEYLQIAQLRTALAWYAHMVVATSPFTAQELHHLAGYPRDRIRIVPLAVPVADFARPQPAGTLDDLRRRWGLAQKRVLIYVGRIAGNKGIDLLIDALALLQPAYPDLHLLIVGDTDQNDMARSLTAQLRQQAARQGVGEQISWTGRVPQIAPYLHLAQIALLPSRHEGFGVPVVEAMAAGVPVIAAAQGALPWVLGADDDVQSEDAAGLLFAPDDAADLAHQVRRLLDDPALYADLVRRGQARARCYTHDRFTANVGQVLDAVEQMAQAGTPVPAQERQLFGYADIALRGYTVRSGAPIVGRWIAAVRRALTSHVKEAYLDRIVERQVNYNEQLALEIARLQQEVRDLQGAIEALRRHGDKGESPKEISPKEVSSEDETP